MTYDLVQISFLSAKRDIKKVTAADFRQESLKTQKDGESRPYAEPEDNADKQYLLECCGTGKDGQLSVWLGTVVYGSNERRKVNEKRLKKKHEFPGIPD